MEIVLLWVVGTLAVFVGLLIGLIWLDRWFFGID